jgi:predicted RNA-binding Zn-ribbon protein involved in translation (DUF1610 family)
MKHNHRIIPGHMGGEYIEGNVISVEVTSCDQQTANHVMWHYANWLLWNKEEDLIAWKGLSGYYGKEDLILERCRLGGRISGGKLRDSGKLAEIGRTIGKIATAPGGWLYENRIEYARLAGLASYPKGLGKMTTEERISIAKRNYAEGVGLSSMSPEDRRKASVKAGLVSGQKHKENKTGVCSISSEEHSKRMSETNKQKWICPECGYSNIARHVNKHMCEEHSLPRSVKIKFKGKDLVSEVPNEQSV